MPPVVATPGLGTCYKMQPDTIQDRFGKIWCKVNEPLFLRYCCLKNLNKGSVYNETKMMDMGLRGELQWEGRNDTIAVKYHGVGRLYGSEKDLQAKGVLMVVCSKLVYKSLLYKSNFNAIKLISDTKSL